MNRIKEVLKNKGISQTWLADQMDKSYTTINEYARNKRQPSLGDLYKIADVLKIDAVELLVQKKKKIEVVAAIIHYKDEILGVQRAQNKYNYIAKKFEFPGGKIEIGETKKEALRRELIEELNISPIINNLFLTVVHQYPDFELTMHSFTCEASSKELTLNEHISLEWLSINELKKLDWAAADIPIVDKLVANG
jgi:8-oxo-dGTP diphosphatase